MTIEIFPLMFNNNGGLVTPVNRELYAAVQQFCLENLAERGDLSRLERVWAAAETDRDGKPGKIVGVAGFTSKIDIPLFRVIDKRATVKIYERMNAFFADRGLTGQSVLLYVSSKEAEAARCPEQRESLEAFKAESADRYEIVVR